MSMTKPVTVTAEVLRKLHLQSFAQLLEATVSAGLSLGIQKTEIAAELRKRAGEVEVDYGKKGAGTSIVPPGMLDPRRAVTGTSF